MLRNNSTNDKKQKNEQKNFYNDSIQMIQVNDDVFDENNVS